MSIQAISWAMFYLVSQLFWLKAAWYKLVLLCVWVHNGKTSLIGRIQYIDQCMYIAGLIKHNNFTHSGVLHHARMNRINRSHFLILLSGQRLQYKFPNISLPLTSRTLMFSLPAEWLVDNIHIMLRTQHHFYINLQKGHCWLHIIGTCCITTV